MIYVFGLLCLLILVVGHEFGHFVVAKLSGVYVNEFAIGMGPTLFSYQSKKSGTKYSVHLFPLGGYCAMKGESDDNTNDSDSFPNVNVWKRIAIVSAGPVFNLLIAFLLCFFLIAGGGYDLAKVSVIDEELKSAVPVEIGDEILSLDGTKILNSRHFNMLVTYWDRVDYKESVDISVRRNGKIMNINYVLPFENCYMLGIVHGVDEETGEDRILGFMTKSAMRDADVGVQEGDVIKSINGVELTKDFGLSDYADKYGITNQVYNMVLAHDDKTYSIDITPTYQHYSKLGFGVETNPVEVENIVKYSFSELKYDVSMVGMALKQLVTGKVSFGAMSGPVGVVQSIGDQYSEVVESKGNEQVNHFRDLLSFLALISVNLGLLNLLPIPALDGGHLVFLFIEVFRKKAVSSQLEMTFHRYGMLALMVFSVVIMIKDFMPLWNQLIFG